MDQSDYRDALRAFLKDQAVKNRLLKFTEESTDDELDLYLNMALGTLSNLSPLLASFTFATFPIPALLLRQATVECLISNGIIQMRNDLTYNNGGITVKVDDGERYLGHIELLYSVIDRMLVQYKKLKVISNIEGSFDGGASGNSFGGVHSPYSYLHGRSSSLQPNSILSS